MKETYHKKGNRTAELSIYELLGIRAFNKFILFVERIKHRKDGLKNHNYHPRNLNYSTLNGFSGYLLYNSSFHVVSLALTVFLLFFCFITDVKSVPYYIVILITIVFNVYCLMLQRYTYLKLKRHMNRKTAVRNTRIMKNASIISGNIKTADNTEISDEYEIINGIRRCTKDGGECVLSESDITILERIADRVEKVVAVKTQVSDNTGKKRETNSADKRTSRLQKLLGVERSRNVLFQYSVITESEAVEKVYRRIFPSDLRDNVEMTVETLYSAYSQKLGNGDHGIERKTETDAEKKKRGTVHRIQ